MHPLPQFDEVWNEHWFETIWTSRLALQASMARKIVPRVDKLAPQRHLTITSVFSTTTTPGRRDLSPCPPESSKKRSFASLLAAYWLQSRPHAVQSSIDALYNLPFTLRSWRTRERGRYTFVTIWIQHDVLRGEFGLSEKNHLLEDGLRPYSVFRIQRVAFPAFGGACD